MVTLRLLLSIFSSSLGMFVFGFNAGAVNNPQAIFRYFYNDTFTSRYGRPLSDINWTILWGFTVAIFSIGGMVGGLIGGWWADKFGRKKGMLINCMCGTVGGIIMGLSKPTGSMELIIIGRLITGFNCGLCTSLSPLYNFEISPKRMRGAIGTSNQLFNNLGMLTSHAVGLTALLGNNSLWPVILGISGMLFLLQLILMSLCPESPRYLMIVQDKEEDAKEALKILRGTDDILNELEEIKTEKNTEGGERIGICQLLRFKPLRLSVLLIAAMHLSQLLTGVNGIFYYSTSLFEDVGMNAVVASYATLTVGGVVVLMTLVTIPLIERVGRRPLHLVGLAGVCVSGIMFTVTYTYKEHEVSLYANLACAFVFVVFFSIGPGPVPWIVGLELFTEGTRSAAVSVGILVNWSCRFLLSQCFPILQKSLKNLLFIPFTILTLVFFIFLYKFLPETKKESKLQNAVITMKNLHSQPSEHSENTTKPDVEDTYM